LKKRESSFDTRDRTLSHRARVDPIEFSGGQRAQKLLWALLNVPNALMFKLLTISAPRF